MADIVVIGAGISGAATAHALAAQGHAVTLLDRFGPAAMASGWTLAGVRQSGRHPAELPLARAAVALWAGLDEALDAPTGYRQEGNLRLARDEADLGRLAAMVAEQSQAGLALEMVDRDGLRALAPAVAEHVPGASHCPSDGHADPRASVAAFVGAAARLGAKLRFGEAALAIEVARGRVVAVRTGQERIPCAGVVLAAGLFGNALLAPLGLSVPLAPRAVTVLRSAPVAPVLRQVIGVADASCAGRQETDGRFRFTGAGSPYAGDLGFEGAPAAGPSIPARIGEVSRVAALFGALVPPALAAPLEASWVGLLDMTPDGLPVIEAAEAVDGLVLAMGFSGHGFCLGPIVGRLCAALATGAAPELDLGPFALGRFQGRRVEPVEPTLHG